MKKYEFCTFFPNLPIGETFLLSGETFLKAGKDTAIGPKATMWRYDWQTNSLIWSNAPTIPSFWDVSDKKQEGGTLTALEKFMYEFDSAKTEESEKFVSMLQDVLVEDRNRGNL